MGTREVWHSKVAMPSAAMTGCGIAELNVRRDGTRVIGCAMAVHKALGPRLYCALLLDGNQNRVSNGIIVPGRGRFDRHDVRAGRHVV